MSLYGGSVTFNVNTFFFAATFSADIVTAFDSSGSQSWLYLVITWMPSSHSRDSHLIGLGTVPDSDC